MEDQTPAPGKGKWFRRLAILFAAMFAVFWSLGSFFFWFFSGLTLYFTFLAIYSSGTKFSLFERKQQDNPYQSYRGQSRPGQGPVSSNPVVRVVKIAAFSFLGFFVFLILVGLFFGEETPVETPLANSEQTETSSSSSSSEADDESYISRGNDLFNNGNYDSAILYYNKQLEQNPRDQDGLFNKSLAYFKKGDYTTSIGLIRRCIDAYPNYNEAYWLLGDNYSTISNLDSAVYCLEKAYDNDFRDSNFLQLMAETYLKKGDRTKARDFYLKVVEQDASNAESYKQLIDLDPENASAYREKLNALEEK